MSYKKHGLIFKLFRALLYIILAIILLAAGMIGFLSVTEYRPDDRESVAVAGNGARTLSCQYCPCGSYVSGVPPGRWHQVYLRYLDIRTMIKFDHSVPPILRQ